MQEELLILTIETTCTNISFNVQNIAPPKTYSVLKKYFQNKRNSLPTDPTLFSD